MCGIAGILKRSDAGPIDEAHLRRMAGELRHRGPDDEGFHIDPQKHCGLAFRRLSIIDVDGGHQPLANENESIWLVFNGEIYNYRELRAELITAGHVFRTQSDSEVIVHGYEEWGTELFTRLAGMFAIAIWDGNEQTLLLARDRLGKKPLHYRWNHGTLHFASELKAILAVPGQSRELSPDGLQEYLLFQYVVQPRTIFLDLHSLPPGTWASWSVRDHRHSPPRPYWQPSTGIEPWSADYDAAKRELGRLLTRAVEKRLMADVPLGAFLSGGIDSSIVVGLMRKLGVSPLRTFSIKFEDPRYDESAHAARVAAHFQTEHHQHVVTPKACDVIETLAYHFDQPFGDSSAIPTYYVAKHTRASVTVALTGDGGDECFMGYDRYQGMRLADRLSHVPIGIRRSIAAAARLLPRGRAKSRSQRLFRFASELGRSPERRYLNWIGVFSPEQLSAGYKPAFLDSFGNNAGGAVREFEEAFNRSRGTSAERANRLDLTTYLPFDLLTKVDIASMACSLECRSPFLDHELVEFALRLPQEWKLGKLGGKHILKDWACALLPNAILQRPKMGFGVPVGEWFRNELRNELEEAFFAADSLIGRIFKPDWLTRLLQEHLSERVNHEHRLWTLYMLENWNRRWKPTIANP